LNEALSIKRLYEVDLPEELPTQIINNNLIVREEPVENLLNELPDVLCLPRGGCYD
jgi:hypothetical protein